MVPLNAFKYTHTDTHSDNHTQSLKHLCTFTLLPFHIPPHKNALTYAPIRCIHNTKQKIYEDKMKLYQLDKLKKKKKLKLTQNIYKDIEKKNH